MLCQACKQREATVHVTVCVPNDSRAMEKMDLCMECAGVKGISDPNAIPLEKLMDALKKGGLSDMLPGDEETT